MATTANCTTPDSSSEAPCTWCGIDPAALLELYDTRAELAEDLSRLQRELEARTAERNSWREAARGYRAERDELRLQLYDLRAELAPELPPELVQWREVPFFNSLNAPRPGYRRAWLAYRHGLGHVTGYTWLSGPSSYRRRVRRSAFGRNGGR